MDEKNKYISVQYSRKEATHLNPGMHTKHNDAWGELMHLVSDAAANGMYPATLVKNKQVCNSHTLSVDLTDDCMIASEIGWEMAEGKPRINEVLNYLRNLEVTGFSYTTMDLVTNFNNLGIECTEEDIVTISNSLGYMIYRGRRDEYAPYSVNSAVMQPIIRDSREVLFIVPPSN